MSEIWRRIKQRENHALSMIIDETVNVCFVMYDFRSLLNKERFKQAGLSRSSNILRLKSVMLRSTVSYRRLFWNLFLKSVFKYAVPADDTAHPRSRHTILLPCMSRAAAAMLSFILLRPSQHILYAPQFSCSAFLGKLFARFKLCFWGLGNSSVPRHRTAVYA